MNRNDYRRALLMLRSLKTGVSGYVRLERRTLIGSLQFTVNGAPIGMKLYAILLYRKNGCWSAVKLDQFGAPRYGQVGLLWKCDPRNIEGRTLEQYDLAAVTGIDGNGVCDLILCGNLNGSIETDWAQVRDAACRLFSPIRISGMPIAPINEANHSKEKDDSLQTLPDFSGTNPLNPVDELAPPPETVTFPEQVDRTCEESLPVEDVPDEDEPLPEADEAGTLTLNAIDDPATRTNPSSEHSLVDRDDLDTPASDSSSAESDELDAPAADSGAEPDELDTPTMDVPSDFLLFSDADEGEMDIPAQESPARKPECAGDQLELTDPNAAWPDSIEPLRKLFFSSEPIVPFESEGYVFIRVPLPEESGISSCLCGLCCENGAPSRICYAIPAQYTPEPPTGLEGYIWRGDRHHGYWAICEEVSSEFNH